jgi:hypothetical protein
VANSYDCPKLLEFVLLVSQHLQTLVELVHLVQVWASQLQEEAHVYMETCLLILFLLLYRIITVIQLINNTKMEDLMDTQ